MESKCFELFTLAGVLSTVLLAQTTEPTLRGFTPANSKQERANEQTFISVPDASHARAELETLTTEPHMAGSKADQRTAEYVLRQFKSYGLEVSMEEFQAELSEPAKVKFELLEPVKFSGPSPEFVAEDPASKDSRTSTNFLAFSASGDVTSTVVYANYGMSNDYDFLRSQGISVEGKIVMARYGKCYRGAKAMAAERNKAAGLIIYSDPEDDGYHAGDVYPAGPWRPESGSQRGSVLYDFIYPGVMADGSTVPHIPMMPVSYGDAHHILENVTGPVAPRDWQGGLPFTYHLGPGPAKVHLDISMNTPRRTIWDVIAKIPGTEKSEEVVLTGNHRDAWVYGAVDPNSGTTALLEMARGLGVLLKQGWRPRRSIWLCSWDAEEPSEFGSTDWAEKHAQELTEKAVAYLNLDSAVSGDQFAAATTPSLKQFILDVAADVPDPAGGSILSHANQQRREQLRRALAPGSTDSGAFGHGFLPRFGLHADTDPKPISEQTIEIRNLGSGTDYVSFFDHLGIPSTDFTFEGTDGVYHSIFDNFRWMEKFGDPKFLYHVAAARFYGLETLRLAQVDLLPLDYEAYGQEIQTYLGEIRRKLILKGRGDRLNFAAAELSAQKLAAIGRALNHRYESFLGQTPQPPDLSRVNHALVNAERAFLLPEGLPGRPWFKHAVFAPAFYNGYEPVVLPGVLESADAEDWDQARQQLQALTVAVNRACDILVPETEFSH